MQMRRRHTLIKGPRPRQEAIVRTTLTGTLLSPSPFRHAKLASAVARGSVVGGARRGGFSLKPA